MALHGVTVRARSVTQHEKTRRAAGLRWVSADSTDLARLLCLP